MNYLKKKWARVLHWRWVLRYWVVDKYREQLRIVFMGFALFVLFVSVFGGVFTYFEVKSEPHKPKEAAYQLIYYLIILIISLLVMMALQPKMEEQKPGENKAPEVEDGKSIRKVYGTVWVDDPMVLAWKDVGTLKIMSKSGKK